MDNQLKSLLIWRGEEYYSLIELLSEYVYLGISSRVPKVDFGLTPDKSLVFVAHPHAIVIINSDVYTMRDLINDLFKAGDRAEVIYKWEIREEFGWNDLEFPGMLEIAGELSAVENRDELIERYEITFMPGIVLWGFYNGTRLVIPNSENKLDEKYSDLLPRISSGDVEPVHVIYPYDEGEFVIYQINLSKYATDLDLSKYATDYIPDEGSPEWYGEEE